MFSLSLRNSALIATAALMSCGLAACSATTSAELGSTIDEVNRLAAEEKEVVVYSAATDDVNASLVRAFNEEHPDIVVTITRMSSGDLKGRFAAESETGAPSADAVILTDPVMFDKNSEWFTPLSADLVPNLRTLPESFVGEAHFGFMVSPWVITYNTDKLPAPPQTWKDLADPAYLRAGSFADPRISSDSVMSFYQILMDSNGPEMLATIGRENDEWFESSVPAVQKVAAGQTTLAAPGAKAHSEALVASGAPVKAVVPTPVIAYNLVAGVAANAEHPNAAMLFSDFMLSTRGQSAICQDALYMTVIDAEVDGCPAAPADTLIADPARAFAERDRILDAFQLD